MTCVMDASATLSWFFEDERTRQLDAVLDLVAESGATVLGLWPLEVANAFLVAHKRAGISKAFRHQAIERLTRLPIVIDLETNTRACTSALPLAEETELSVYDAFYLELAIRLNVPLASADRKLCNAAKRAGVSLIATA